MEEEVIISRLVVEPFNLSMREIELMTMYQLSKVYFRDRKHDEPEGDTKPYKEIFWAMWRKRGLEEPDIQEKWKLYLAESES